MKTFMDGRVTLHAGDCLEVLKTFPDNSIDSCVTDPPYHLTSIVKRFGKEKSNLERNDSGLQLPSNKGGGGTVSPYKRVASGFMGRTWDGGDIAQNPVLWSEVLRVLKPGGHCVAFSGTRTYHLMATAIDHAGFEIRDQIQWIFGSGFPKSHSMRDIGHPELGTALKPANEPICLARKPLSEKTVAANCLRWGTGAINVDGCRVGSGDKPFSYPNGPGGCKSGEFHYQGRASTPAQGSPLGRWPANLCHDGSQEVLDLFPETKSGNGDRRGAKDVGIYGAFKAGDTPRPFDGDSGSAARFFYCAKASKADRAGSSHPTVKPIKLMQWLCRLITPPGGTVLDPFAGSGTTGMAAILEGFQPIMIEREEEYLADIERRMDRPVADIKAEADEVVERVGPTVAPQATISAKAAE